MSHPKPKQSRTRGQAHKPHSKKTRVIIKMNVQTKKLSPHCHLDSMFEDFEYVSLHAS